jgi:diguanylate cyclase (GGDEF)-like protein
MPPQVQFLRKREAFLIAAVLAALHAISILAFSAHSMALSYSFTLFIPLLAIWTCFHKGRSADFKVKWKWTAFCMGLCLWEAGLAMAAWEDLLDKNQLLVNEFSGFVYFLFGVPLLLAICGSRNDENIPAIVWIDGIMAVAIGVLAYREVFSFIPGINEPRELATVSGIAYTYDAENVLLALLSSVRLLASEISEERTFYNALSKFLWLYVLVSAAYNHIVVVHWQWSMGHPIDFIIDIAFLFLAWIALFGSDAPPVVHLSRTPMLIIQTGIAFSLPLVLLILGILGMRHSPRLGIAAIVCSLTGYGLRATLAQAKLLEEEDKLIRSQQVLEKAAMIDALTGVANRRAFDLLFEQEWRRALRSGEGLAIVLLDIDHFKKMNDTYGHLRGDECLRSVATALKESLSRGGDVVARYGGEEFACILPATNPDGAFRVASRMCAAVSALKIEHRVSEHGIVTISAGVAMCSRCSEMQPSALLAQADKALYRAKQKGRNSAELIGDLNDLGILCRFQSGFQVLNPIIQTKL